MLLRTIQELRCKPVAVAAENGNSCRQFCKHLGFMRTYDQKVNIVMRYQPFDPFDAQVSCPAGGKLLHNK